MIAQTHYDICCRSLYYFWIITLFSDSWLFIMSQKSIKSPPKDSSPPPKQNPATKKCLKTNNYATKGCDSPPYHIERSPGKEASKSTPPESRERAMIVPTQSSSATENVLANDSVNLAIKSGADTNASSQLRSTLAIGQLIASNRPTAGSRLVANELKQLTLCIQDEAALLRKEIATLSNNLVNSLKSVADDERERRNSSIGFGRGRGLFNHFASRRFPLFPRRHALRNNVPREPGQSRGSQATVSPRRLNASTNTSPTSPSPLESPRETSSAPSNLMPNTLKSLATKETSAQKQVASSADEPAAKNTAVKAVHIIWNPWSVLGNMPGENDSDSDDTTPNPSP